MDIKLTDQNGQTHGNTQWGEGITHATDGNGRMCGPGWIHFYPDALIAPLANPIHADFHNPRMWEVRMEGEIQHEPLKSGGTKCTTLRELLYPEMPIAVNVRWAILCAQAGGYTEPTWDTWAQAWLSDQNRSAEAAKVAWEAPHVAWAAAWAAVEAAHVPWAAAEAAKVAEVAAEWAAAEAAKVVWAAAKVAEVAAEWAEAEAAVDVISLAHQAYEAEVGSKFQVHSLGWGQ